MQSSVVTSAILTLKILSVPFGYNRIGYGNLDYTWFMSHHAVIVGKFCNCSYFLHNNAFISNSHHHRPLPTDYVNQQKVGGGFFYIFKGPANDLIDKPKQWNNPKSWGSGRTNMLVTTSDHFLCLICCLYNRNRILLMGGRRGGVASDQTVVPDCEWCENTFYCITGVQ